MKPFLPIFEKFLNITFESRNIQNMSLLFGWNSFSEVGQILHFTNFQYFNREGYETYFSSFHQQPSWYFVAYKIFYHFYRKQKIYQFLLKIPKPTNSQITLMNYSFWFLCRYPIQKSYLSSFRFLSRSALCTGFSPSRYWLKWY